FRVALTAERSRPRPLEEELAHFRFRVEVRGVAEAEKTGEREHERESFSHRLLSGGPAARARAARCREPSGAAREWRFAGAFLRRFRPSRPAGSPARASSRTPPRSWPRAYGPPPRAR